MPENLPVREELIIEPNEIKAEPHAWRQMGDEVTEQLDYTPGKFSKRRIIRRSRAEQTASRRLPRSGECRGAARSKYVKRDEPYLAPVIAVLPVLMERCMAAPGLRAFLIVSKYCDHLPLYRIEQIIKQRHGISIPRQSMARWVAWAARCLVPIYERFHAEVMSGGYVQIDETMIEYLEPGNGETTQGWFWVIKRPGGDSVFVWKATRAGKALKQIIPADYQGKIGCDGYQVYASHAEASAGRIELATCWAHVRRKYREALEAAPLSAFCILEQISNLYRIEARLRESKASPKLRRMAREVEAAPIIARIGKLLGAWQSKHKHLPQSLIGKAIAYTQNLWPKLQTYLSDGSVEIDNNLVENAIRPTAIGKKNYPSCLGLRTLASHGYCRSAAWRWLFIGEANAGDTSAILFTLIEACRTRKLNAWSYLREVLTSLPTMTNQQIEAVMPEARAKLQHTAAAAASVPAEKNRRAA